MSYLPAIFSILVAAAGWHYMFFSNAATKLAGVEPSPANRLRVFLRRIGGISMMALAVAFYIAMATENPVIFSACLIAVFVLLMLIVSLGLYDLKLTSHMRQSRREEEHS